jgi:hypothetical protein
LTSPHAVHTLRFHSGIVSSQHHTHMLLPI